LLEQDGADETGNGCSVGADAHNFDAAVSWYRRSPLHNPPEVTAGTVETAVDQRVE